MKLVCDKCQKNGLGFYSEHILPEQYIEGNPKADIWIIGLNPKSNIGNVEKRTVEDFKNFDPDCHRYFSDFKKASKDLYANWKSDKSRIAHTDLVKCFSNSFPPKIEVNGKLKKVKIDEVVKNCSVYLITQIKTSKPKVIICNGSDVSWQMLKLFPPIEQPDDWKTLTSYQTILKIDNTDYKMWIVLSGFIGRIDDRNKRRLGKEIEEILKKEEIKLN